MKINLKMKEQILLEEIKHENTTYILSEPLEIEINKEDYFATHNKKLHINGFGITREEAIQSFKEEFDFIYRRYNQLVDSLLSEKVIEIKKELNRIVKEVLTVKK